MSATGELRERLVQVMNLAQQLVDELDEVYQRANELDDNAINAADPFITDHRNTGNAA